MDGVKTCKRSGDKICYEDRAEALIAIQVHPKWFGELYSYKCNFCYRWHLTRLSGEEFREAGEKNWEERKKLNQKKRLRTNEGNRRSA